jgi:hypothetical protein
MYSYSDRLYTVCVLVACRVPYAEEHMVYRTAASYMEKPYSVPARALYGEDHTVAGLLGDYLWGWGA